MNCLHYQQTLSKGMDGEANKEAFAAARRHCRQCERCSVFYEAIAGIDSRLGALLEPVASSALKARVKAAIADGTSRSWPRFRLHTLIPVYAALVLLAVAIGSFAGKTLIASDYHERAGEVFNLVAPTTENTLAEAVIELTPRESAQ